MIGDDSIILDGRGEPACVIKTLALRLRYDQVTAEMGQRGRRQKPGVLARGIRRSLPARALLRRTCGWCSKSSNGLKRCESQGRKDELHLRHRGGQGAVPKIWEDDDHLAFLSIFPNTDGFSVVIPKAHHPNAFDLPDEVLSAGDQAGASWTAHSTTSAVAAWCSRATASIMHAKLIPLHGTASLDQWRPIESTSPKFFERYEGYIPPRRRARATIGWRRWPPASAKAPFKARTINAGH